MKNFKCKIGLHKYNIVGEQVSLNLVNMVSGVHLTRIVHMCEICGQIKYTTYDISANRINLYSDSKLWKPELDLSLQYRKVKINGLQRRIRKTK